MRAERPRRARRSKDPMMYPTLLLTNGRFHTLTPAQPPVTAVAIHHGRLVAAGRDADVLPLAGPETERVDLAGRCVTPGLVDAHVHFQSFALSRWRLDLSQTRSLDDALERIAAFLAAAPLPGGVWLQGRGWNQANWPDGRFPHRRAA
jgi:predicted amidohydrolase YtcJ